MSETETIVRDIFGDSDESDDEFEGFEGDNSENKQSEDKTGDDEEDDNDDDDDDQRKTSSKERRILSSDEESGNENEAGEQPQPSGSFDDNEEGVEDERKSKEIIPDISDSESGSDDEGMNREDKSGIMYDFDIMLQRRKEMNSRRRRRKNVDIINDSDDIIAELIQNMKIAAEDDFELNRNRMTATRKLKILPMVESQLKKIDLREALLDSGILSVMTDWLTRLPDGSLPHFQIREKLLKILTEFNIDDTDRIKASGIGKAVMYLFKHPKETKENKKIAGQLIATWARPIFNLDTNFHSISRDEREQRDLESMAKYKRSLSDSADTPNKNAKTEEKATRPGDKGWVPRARVPMPSMKDYVIRPKSTVEVEMTRISSKKPITRFEKHLRNFREMKKINKMNRAVQISIEGRKMAL